jgi:hypothetical protein
VRVDGKEGAGALELRGPAVEEDLAVTLLLLTAGWHCEYPEMISEVGNGNGGVAYIDRPLRRQNLDNVLVRSKTGLRIDPMAVRRWVGHSVMMSWSV